jgi:hypothetical protein
VNEGRSGDVLKGEKDHPRMSLLIATVEMARVVFRDTRARHFRRDLPWGLFVCGCFLWRWVWLGNVVSRRRNRVDGIIRAKTVTKAVRPVSITPAGYVVTRVSHVSAKALMGWSGDGIFGWLVY